MSLDDAWANDREELRTAHLDDHLYPDARDEYEPDRPDATGVYARDRTAFPLSPDCRDRKCAACIGTAWDVEADDLTACCCACHDTKGPA